jgi:hypothetical protein
MPRQPDSFDQPYLLPANDVVGPPPSTGPGAAMRRRKRGLDEPVLRFVAHFGVVTTYQVLYRFFSFRGKSPVYGWRLLKHLREAGLLHFEPVFPELGAASMHALRLTAAGWAAIGQPPRKDDLAPLTPGRLHYLLQHAEMMLVRGQEGWREVRPDAAFRVLKRWALAGYRDRLLNDHEILARTRLERIPEELLKVPLLLHPASADIRLVLGAEGGRDFRRELRRLPDFQLFPPIGVEFVCAEPELAEEARRALARHAERRRYQLVLHRAPSFSARPNPRLAIAAPPEGDAG